MRLYFTYTPPERAPSAVLVQEQADVVRISLALPVVAGKMSAVISCVDLQLRSPLNSRDVFDGSTGREATRVYRRADGSLPLIGDYKGPAACGHAVATYI